MRNDSAATVVGVRIAMLVGGVPVTTVEDGDTLAPGATATPWLQLDTLAFPLTGRTTCAPAVVHFGDGTTWTNPVLGAMPGHQLAQTPGAPIRIKGCFLQEETPAYPATVPTGAVWTRFVNEAAVRATHIAFSLIVAGERIDRYEQRGSFEPRVSTLQSSDADANIFPPADVHPQCRVDGVDFADGSRWINPAARFEPFGTYQTPGAKIDVLACAMHSNEKDDHSVANGIAFQFRNTAVVAATEVDFSFWGRGTRLARGTFGETYPTGAVTKFYGVGLGSQTFPFGTTIADCKVERVVYEDGTVWTPSPAP